MFIASTGTPFAFAHLASEQAVDRADVTARTLRKHLGERTVGIFFYAGEPADGATLYARMCAPASGVPEDPATGSAAAALVGAFGVDPAITGDRVRLTIRQGIAMGRPSEILAVAERDGGKLASISVSGDATYVAGGQIDVPSAYLTT